METTKEELRKRFDYFLKTEHISCGGYISPDDWTSKPDEVFDFFWKEIEAREKQADKEPIEFFRWLHKTNKVSLNKKLFRKHIDQVYNDYKLTNGGKEPHHSPV